VKILKYYLSLIRISHLLFSLPFCLIGIIQGYLNRTNYKSVYLLSLLTIICLFLARSAALIFNRIIDKNIDALNPRTANREIPSGKISVKFAYLLLFLNIFSFIFVSYFINKTVFYLSPIAILFVLFYSYTKRFTYFSHLLLGISFSLSVVGSYLVFSEKINNQILIITLMVIFWVTGFDILYSLQDFDFDLKYKLYSLPAKFGLKKSKIIAFISHLISITLSFLYGIFFSLSFFYWIGFVLFSFFLLFQHYKIFSLSKEELNKVNYYFTKYNILAAVLFSIFYLFDFIFYELFFCDFLICG